MNKMFAQLKTIVKDPEFQKTVIIGVVNTATLVIVSAAIHAATTGITNAVSAAMDKMNEETVVTEIPEVTTV